MYPGVNLLAFHGVEDLSELFYFLIGVLFLSFTFESVEFLIVKIEVAVVIPFRAVGVPAAAYTALLRYILFRTKKAATIRMSISVRIIVLCIRFGMFVTLLR